MSSYNIDFFDSGAPCPMTHLNAYNHVLVVELDYYYYEHNHSIFFKLLCDFMYFYEVHTNKLGYM